MLEATTYNANHEIYSLRGYFMDFCRGSSTAASVTEVCTPYFDVVIKSFKGLQSPDSKEAELGEWDTQTGNRNQWFVPYQTLIRYLVWQHQNDMP